MAKVWGLLGIILFVGTGSTPQHAIYLSLTEVRYEPQTGAMTMGVRIFSDDLEDALRLYFGESIPVIGHWQNPELEPKVREYLLEKIRFTPMPSDWQLVSLYQQNDATWIEFSATGPLNQRSWEVQSELLLNVFDTQRNIVKVFYRDDLQVVSLDKSSSHASFEW